MNFYTKTVIKIKNKFHQHWPLITALTALWVTITILLLISLNINQGHFVYGLDDAYIHMDIAKNFAMHGVWGVTPYGFSSSASSILWPLIISSIYLISGPNDLVPFVLNVILATATVFLVYYILKSFKIRPIYNMMVLMAVIFFTPIPSLIFIGMEHILQIILVIAFVYLSAQILTNVNSKPLQYYSLVILAVLLAMTRYESLILIFIVAALFFLKKRFMYSFSIIGFALIPVVLYGAISILNGWSFLPNSLLIKSSVANIFNTPLNSLPQATYYLFVPSEISQGIADLTAVISALILFAIARFRFKEGKTVWREPVLWLAIAGTLIFAQLIFINKDWFLRYTSYLVPLGLMAIIIGVHEYLPQKLYFNFNKKLIPKYFGIAALAILLLTPFAAKSYDLSIIPQSTNDIYEQQYQMGLFLKEYYQNDSVAANDIGAVNYIANIKCLDLVGLSSNDVAIAHKTNTFNAQELGNLSREHQVKIAVVYDEWWQGDIPSNWIKVGEWTTPHSVILGNATVSFYATSPENAAELIGNLRSFSSKLPGDVQQSGIYATN